MNRVHGGCRATLTWVKPAKASSMTDLIFQDLRLRESPLIRIKVHTAFRNILVCHLFDRDQQIPQLSATFIC